VTLAVSAGRDADVEPRGDRDLAEALDIDAAGELWADLMTIADASLGDEYVRGTGASNSRSTENPLPSAARISAR
jgi:hypothetical protein